MRSFAFIPFAERHAALSAVKAFARAEFDVQLARRPATDVIAVAPPPEQLSRADPAVTSWLKGLRDPVSLHAFEQFRIHAVQLRDLIGLNKEQLTEYLAITTFGDIKAILRGVDELKAAADKVERRAKEERLLLQEIKAEQDAAKHLAAINMPSPATTVVASLGAWSSAPCSGAPALHELHSHMELGSHGVDEDDHHSHQAVDEPAAVKKEDAPEAQPAQVKLLEQEKEESHELSLDAAAEDPSSSPDELPPLQPEPTEPVVEPAASTVSGPTEAEGRPHQKLSPAVQKVITHARGLLLDGRRIISSSDISAVEKSTMVEIINEALAAKGYERVYNMKKLLDHLWYRENYGSKSKPKIKPKAIADDGKEPKPNEGTKGKKNKTHKKKIWRLRSPAEHEHEHAPIATRLRARERSLSFREARLPQDCHGNEWDVKKGDHLNYQYTNNYATATATGLESNNGAVESVGGGSGAPLTGNYYAGVLVKVDWSGAKENDGIPRLHVRITDDEVSDGGVRPSPDWHSGMGLRVECVQLTHQGRLFLPG